jgi:hypothetical protein
VIEVTCDPKGLVYEAFLLNLEAYVAVLLIPVTFQLKDA